MIWRLAAAMARLLPPEAAHRAAVMTLRHRIGPTPDLPSIPVSVAGLDFRNPLGLAAGFDKDMACPDGALRLGFGHVELGTITPQPQPGNPRPRVFRLPADRAVINRYGFNSRGMEAAASRLDARRETGRQQAGIIGVNVGANKTSPAPTEDYRIAVARLATFADYITLNISSPNTPGLRDLQTADNLRLLIAAGRAGLAEAGCERPLFVKLAPDLAPADIEAIAATAADAGIAALIATNTTIARPEGLCSAHAGEAGGLSGAPLFAMATHVLAEIAGRLPSGGPALVGAGGVASGWQAYAKILVGASLVQLYTALAFEGPDLPARVIRELATLMAADGVTDIAAARGQIPDPDKAMQHALHLAQSA
ncbi:MAG: quinone-dependent dihydroorotate dehydrogenase [Pseudomonadota bacterium]|nr:quinone-dependent dihydroorotate dehydrogenase [Pseudomonadota bacterium]